MKKQYGAEYKLVVDKGVGYSPEQLRVLTELVTSSVPGASMNEGAAVEDQITYSLPFQAVAHFGPFFTRLEGMLEALNLSNMGVTITTLEEVFLSVGGDSTARPPDPSVSGVGQRTFRPSFIGQVVIDVECAKVIIEDQLRIFFHPFHALDQVLGIIGLKLWLSFKNFSTLGMIGFPIAMAIVAIVAAGSDIDYTYVYIFYILGYLSEY